MIGKKEKVTVGPGSQLRYTGVFDLDRLYSEIKNWFGENEYDFYEKAHTDKSKPKGKELKYTFLGEREVTDYFKYNITVQFFIQEVNPVSGNLVHGKAKVTISGVLEMDHHNKWQRSAFSDFLFRIYNNHIIRRDIEKRKEDLYDDVVNLHDLAKDILDFNR